MDELPQNQCLLLLVFLILYFRWTLQMLLFMSILIMENLVVYQWMAQGFSETYKSLSWTWTHDSSFIFFIVMAAVYGLVLLVHGYNMWKSENTLFKISKINFFTYILTVVSGILSHQYYVREQRALKIASFWLTTLSFFISAFQKFIQKKKQLSKDPRINLQIKQQPRGNQSQTVVNI